MAGKRYQSNKYIAFVAALLCWCSPLFAESAPESVKIKQIIPTTNDLNIRFSLLLRRLEDGIKYEVLFSNVLEDRSINELDKINLFYMLLRTAGVAFNGSVIIPDGMSYHDLMLHTTHLFSIVAKDFEGKKISARPYLALLRELAPTDGTRRGIALLISFIIDGGDDVRTAFVELTEEISDETSILLHYLSLSIAIAPNEYTLNAFAPLLNKLEGEESREDVLVGLSSVGTVQAGKFVTDFIAARIKNSFDLEIETALHAVRAHMQASNFEDYFASLIQVASDKGRKHLEEFKANNFEYSLSGAIKVWDDCNLTIYEDGAHVKFQGVEDFLPIRP